MEYINAIAIVAAAAVVANAVVIVEMGKFVVVTNCRLALSSVLHVEWMHVIQRDSCRRGHVVIKESASFYH